MGSGFFFLPEIHDVLLYHVGVKQIVVSASCDQVLSLRPVGRLIIVTDEANHRSVICKLDDGVGSVHRPGVVGKKGVEERAQNTAL